LNVLSLFDGISCGQIALEKNGIKVDKYYASEIDKYAVKITKKNYPETIHVGDIKEIDDSFIKEISPIHLLIGGSPCQNLSRAVINRDSYNQGLKGEKSKLFYEFVRVLDLVEKYNPNFKFMFENVASMKDEDKEIISETLYTKPQLINSALFSAQDRKRYYWTNININKKPEKNTQVLRDILEPADVVTEIENNGRMNFWYDEKLKIDMNKRVVAKLSISSYDTINRVYNPNHKSPTLTTAQGGHRQAKVLQDGRARKLLPIEYERLQNVPDNYTEGVSNTQRYKMLGNGWTVNVISFIFNNLVLEEEKVA
jgi:DNA (cytosine-5)-methyltransferase 3A